LLLKGDTGTVKKGLKQGKYSDELVIQAILLNNLNRIISQTTELLMDVSKNDPKGRKGLMRGMVPLSSKITIDKYTAQSLRSALSTLGISSFELKNFGYRTTNDGLIIPLAFDVLLSSYRGSRVVDSEGSTYLTHSLTTAIIHYAGKGGEAGK